MPEIRDTSFQQFSPDEDPSARTERLGRFSREFSASLDPQLLQNIGVPEEVAHRFETKWRDIYGAVKPKFKNEEGSTNDPVDIPFGSWMAGNAQLIMRRWDQVTRNGTPEEKAEMEASPIDPRKMATLMAEFEQRDFRWQNRDEAQQINSQFKQAGVVGEVALGIFKGAREFAKERTFGAVDVDALNMAVASAFGADDYVKRYAKGLGIEEQLVNESNIAKFEAGLGGLIGTIQSFGSLGALGKKAAGTAGAKAVAKTGGKRAAINEFLAGTLGHLPEGAGLGARTLASSGQFLNHSVITEYTRAFNAGLSAAAQNDPDGFGGNFVESLKGASPRLLSSIIGGAAMPWMQRGGQLASRFILGRAGNAARIAAGTTLMKNVGDLSPRLRTQAWFARGVGGAVEFLPFSTLPNFHSDETGWGVSSDFLNLFSDDPEIRDEAVVNIGLHLANGFTIKANTRLTQGKKEAGNQPVSGAPLSRRDRAKINFPQAVEGVFDVMTRAKRGSQKPTEKVRKAEEQALRKGLVEALGDKGEEVAAAIIVQQQLIEGLARVGGSAPLVDPARDGVIPKALVAVAHQELQKIKDKKKAGEQLTPEENLLLHRATSEDIRLKIARAEAKLRGMIDKDGNVKPSEKRDEEGNLLPESSREDALKAQERIGALKQRQRAVDDALSNLIINEVNEKVAETNTDLKGRIESLPPGSRFRPLVPGKTAEPISGDPAEGSKLTFPEGFAVEALNREVLVQTGTTQDGKPIFRPVTVMEVNMKRGTVLARDADGQHFMFTPKEIAKGYVRGGAFDKLVTRDLSKGKFPRVQPGDAEGAALELERQQIAERGEVVIDKKRPFVDEVLGSLATPEGNEALRKLRTQGKPKLSPEEVKELREFLNTKRTEFADQKDPALIEVEQLRESLREIETAQADAAQAEAGTARDKALGKKPKVTGRFGSARKPKKQVEIVPESEQSDKKRGRRKPGKVRAIESQSPEGRKKKRRLGDRGTPVGETPEPATPETPTTKGKSKSKGKPKGEPKTEPEGTVVADELTRRLLDKLTDAQRAADTDVRTGVRNERAWEKDKDALHKLAKRGKARFAVVDMSNAGAPNKSEDFAKGVASQDIGDVVFGKAGETIRELAAKHGLSERNLFRTGGDEFTIFDRDGDKVRSLAKELNELKAIWEATDNRGRNIRVEFDVGVARTHIKADGISQAQKKAKTKAGRIAFRDSGSPAGTVSVSNIGTDATVPGLEKFNVRATDDPTRPSGFSVGVYRGEDSFAGRINLSKGKDGYARVDEVRVDSAFRRMGIGIGLYRAALAEAARRGFKGIEDGGKQGPGAKAIWAKLEATDVNGVMRLDSQVPTGEDGKATGVPSPETKPPSGGATTEPPVKNTKDLTPDAPTTVQQILKRLSEVVQTGKAKGSTKEQIAAGVAADPDVSVGNLSKVHADLVDGPVKDAVGEILTMKREAEHIDRRYKNDKEMRDRTAPATNPAKALKLQDEALSASQIEARDLAFDFQKKLKEGRDAILKGRDRESLNSVQRDRVEEYEIQLRAVDSLLERVPSGSEFRLEHGGIIPRIKQGDLVSIVYPSEDGGIPTLTKGLVLDDPGAPSGASLKRGAGPKGQFIRGLRDRVVRGEKLSRADQKALERASLLPGRRVKIYLPDGKIVRVRSTDISEIMPDEFDANTFGYNPESMDHSVPRRGVEVTERVFISWFDPPDVSLPKDRPTSREKDTKDEFGNVIKGGSGEKAMANLRLESLMADETEGYYRETTKKGKNRVEIITPLEAARIEAQNLGAQLRANNIHPDNATLRARAMLAYPSNREFVEVNVLHSSEKANQSEQQLEKIPYVEPGTKLRNPSELSEKDRFEYDFWSGVADAAKDQRKQNVDLKSAQLRMEMRDTNHDTGEFIFNWRQDGRSDEKGMVRDGQMILAERTPEGTIWARKVSTAELREWLDRHGRTETYTEWTNRTRRERQNLSAEHNRRINALRKDGETRNMLKVLMDQAEMMARGERFKFPGEFQFHDRVAEFLDNNPPPEADAAGWGSWKRGFDSWIMSSGVETVLAGGSIGEGAQVIEGKGKGKGTREAQVLIGDVEGIARNVRAERAGPMFEAIQSVEAGFSPAGAKISANEKTGDFNYVNQAEGANDFYKLWLAERVQLDLSKKGDKDLYLSMAGIGAVHRGVGPMFRALLSKGKMAIPNIKRAAVGTNEVIDGVWGGAMDAITAPLQVTLDNLVFERVHDLLHNPSDTPLFGARGKSIALKIGELFGDRDNASNVRLYMNDYEGNRFGVGQRSEKSIREFKKFDAWEQEKMLVDFENGKVHESLKEYKEYIDELGDELTQLGVFSKDAIKRFKGRYVHYGMWEWTADNIAENLKAARKELSDFGGVDSQSPIITELMNYIEDLTVAESKLELNGDHRSYISSRPLDRVPIAAMNKMKRDGFMRQRTHTDILSAKKDGLVMDEPWRHLMTGMIVEGQALAQAKLLLTILADPLIVSDPKNPKPGWVTMNDPMFMSDNIFKQFVGKQIEPHALGIIELLNPERNRALGFYDMMHGIAKAGLTLGNFGNYWTQFLGNNAMLASSGMPTYQIPFRVAQNLIALAFNSEKKAKYDSWNWTSAPQDAVREMVSMLDGAGGRTASGGGIGETFKRIKQQAGGIASDATRRFGGKKGQRSAALDPQSQNMHLGMGFFQKLGTAMSEGALSIAAGGLVTKTGRARAKKSLLAGTQVMVDFFTSIDAAYRISLHEYNVNMRGMGEEDSRRFVDKRFDIMHLPKGWRVTRRFIDSFSSIKAIFARNVNTLIPNTLAGTLNLAVMNGAWNLVMQMVTGTDDQEFDDLLEASISKENSAANWRGRMTALAMPNFASGGLRFIDGEKFNPTNVALQALPLQMSGLSTLYRGAESMLFDGEWNPVNENGHTGGFDMMNSLTGNVLSGPTIDWYTDRDRFNQGQGIQHKFNKPGSFGLKGFLRFQIERGPAAQVAASLLPPGVREAIGPISRTGVQLLRNLDRATGGKILSTPSQFIGEAQGRGKTLRENSLSVRRYGLKDVAQDFIGMRFERADQIARIRELIENEAMNQGFVEKTPRGIQTARDLERGSEPRRLGKLAVSDMRALNILSSSRLLVGAIRLWKEEKSAENENELKRLVGSDTRVKKMIYTLRLHRQYDIVKEISSFLQTTEGRKMIVPERQTVPSSGGRFGSPRER